jgi:O-antigen/teichoic acid export membrane protein
MNSARHGLVRGSIIIAASMVAAGVLSLLTSIILARSVDVREFGFFSMTFSLQAVLGLFAGFSIGTAVAKYVAEYNVRDFRHALRFARTGLWLVLLFSTVTSFVYFALAIPIGNGLYNEPGIADLIPFSAMAVFSGAVFSLIAGIAQGNHRMELLFSMQISAPAISLVIIVILLPYVGIRAAFVGLFLAQATVTLLAAYWLGRTGFPMVGKVESDDLVRYPRTLLMFAVPAVAGSVIVVPLFWFGSTVLALESGFVAVGQFAIAMVFFQALSLLPSSITTPLVPMISAMSVDSREQIESLISRSLRAVSVLLFPIFFAIALFAGEIVAVLYGPEYDGSSKAVYLMVTACYYVAIASILGAAITGLGRMWVGLGLNLLWGAIFLTLVLVATPSYGPTGLGLAFAISYGIHLANSIAVSNRILNLKIRNVFLIIILSIALFAAGVLTMMDVIEFPLTARISLLAVGTAPMVYLGREEYMMVLRRVFKRL